MSKNLFIVIVLCFSISGKAQQGYVYNFEKLRVLDTIADLQEIETLKQEAAVFNAALFYSTAYIKDGVGVSALFWKNAKQWVVYEAPFGGTNIVNFITYSDDGNYAFVEVDFHGMPSQFGESEGQETYIIDLKNGSYTALTTGDYTHHITRGNENDEFGDSSYFASESKIIINGNTLTILDFSFSRHVTGPSKGTGFGEADSRAGIYELRGQQMVKTHYYDVSDKRMKPIIYAGDLAIGMDMYAAKNAISQYDEDVELITATARFYGYDSDLYGEEITVSWEPHYFVLTEELPDDVRRITELTIISPKVIVHGLHPGMTAGEALEKYSDAELGIDPVSDWEYIYIREQHLKLWFRDSGNRIAQYETAKDGSLRPVRLLDKARKVDYIMVVK